MTPEPEVLLDVHKLEVVYHRVAIAVQGVSLRVPRGQATETAARLLSHIKLDDVLIEEPPVEDIIRQVFAESKAEREKG